MAHIPLNKELPFPGRIRWGYQHFPVFGFKWWLGRSMVFGLGATTLSLATGTGMVLGFSDKYAAINATAHFLMAMLGMVLIGASLATLSRSYIKPGRLQATAVTISLLLGIVGAAAMDARGSKVIEDAFREYSSNKEEMNAMMDSSRDLSNTALALFNATTVFIIYFWCAGGIAYIRYWREPGLMRQWLASRELLEARADKQQAEARLGMLQAQIEPHFLFNTLASVKSVLREQPQRAERAIDDLVDYLRASIPRFNGDSEIKVVSIDEQLILCEKYLQLMQLRMGERLTFSTQVSEAMQGQLMPPLMLISLVENAIKHGLEPKTSGGDISIRVSNSGTDALFEVIDSGVGLNGSTSINSNGVGLKNLRDQLQVVYGDRASLELSSNLQGGVTAQIHIRDFIKEAG